LRQLLRYTNGSRPRESSAAAASASTNLLLRHLPEGDRELLESQGTYVNFDSGTVIVDIGDVLRFVYFPIDTFISVEQTGGLEAGVVGREGMFGWSGVGAFSVSPFRAVVGNRGGALLQVPLASMLVLMSKSEALGALLREYLIVIAIQSAESLVAFSCHRTESRLARWLLTRHDRVGGDLMFARHDQIAQNIGSRRASVTDCLHILEGEGDLRCRRGKIYIRDRGALLLRASGCYGLAEEHYRNCIGAFGKL
jgi:CRP-like cAMP-binding protein